MTQPRGNQFISEIQLYDKYARWIPTEERRETWPEVTDRVITFLKTIPESRKLPQATWDALSQSMLRKEVLPSMRIVQMAGPALERCHVGAYNCLAGDEQFVTRNGLMSFAAAEGTTQEVLCADGEWRPATVSQFGVEKVQVITFRPGDTKTGLRHAVKATASHGWVTTRGQVRDLQVGDQVLANAAADQGTNEDWVRGFLFGDGTVQDRRAHIRLCGEKQQHLDRLQIYGAKVSYPASCNGEPLVAWPKGVFALCKELPEVPTAQWLQGYFAADGDQGRQPTISTVREDVLPYLRQHSAELGIIVTGHTVWTKPSNFGPRQPLHKIGIRKAGFTNWRVLSIEETDEEVPVYCVTEPVTHTFTLSHGLSSTNCAYTTLAGPRDLAELLYILMQGTGVGYSVERKYVDQWPHPKTYQPTGNSHKLIIEDTTEGWCNAFRTAMESAMNAHVQSFDYSRIRPEGAWLHTKGGRASGPEPLRQLLDKTSEIIRARAGQRLRPIDIHRLATMCGSIVQVGGVRRAAELALFDEGDPEMTRCKEGEFWNEMPELAMANNSVVATGPVVDRHLLQWMAQLSSTGSGEPGIFRRDGVVPARRIGTHDYGTNPCGEIILRPQQFCNLSVAVARPDETLHTLTKKVTLAAVLGTLQSCLTTFSYLGPSWKVNCDEERLLGVDITGACDCPLLTNPSTLPSVLTQLQSQAVRVNVTTAALLGIPVSAAVTCNKPSGNSAQFLDTSSGIHARYAPFYIRRLRIQARSPLAEHLRGLGLPVYPEVSQGTLEEARTWVVELPVKSPEGAVTRADMSAVDQLSYWLMWKQHWTEHNPSCTIYVRPDEWVSVTAFLRLHWQHIGGLSFMPKDDHTYALAPYEEIDEDTYRRRCAGLPQSLDLGSIREAADFTTINQEYACTSGVCEI